MSNQYNEEHARAIMISHITNRLNAARNNSSMMPSTIFSATDEQFNYMIDQIGPDGENVFHTAAMKASKEELEYTFQKLEKLANREKIRKLLSALNIRGQSMLQFATVFNPSMEVHQLLWTILRKYFESFEILDMIKQAEVHGNNLLFIIGTVCPINVSGFTWNQIMIEFKRNQNVGLLEWLSHVDMKGQNVLHLLMLRGDEEKMIFLWKRLENTLNSMQQFKELFKQKIIENGKNVFHLAALNDNIKFHKVFWILLLSSFDNFEDLMDLLLDRNSDGDDYMHYIVAYNELQVIKFTFNKIEKIFGEPQYQDILKSKGSINRNLLQMALYASKDIKVHQFLWTVFKKLCGIPNQLLFSCTTTTGNYEEFLKILMEIDDQKSNVFHVAVAFSTSEIFTFMMKSLASLASRDEIRDILRTLSFNNRNLLQMAAGQNFSLELHEQLWKYIHKYFDLLEVAEMICHEDSNSYNYILCVAEQNTKEVAELAWNKIFATLMCINARSLTDYLRHANHINFNIVSLLVKSNDPEKLTLLYKRVENQFKAQNLHHQFKELMIQKNTFNNMTAFQYTAKSDSLRFHEAFWSLLLCTFKNREEIKDMIMNRWNYDANYMLILLSLGKSDILEFIFGKFKEIFSHDTCKEILKSTGISGKNVLHVAVFGKADLKVHQMLWMIMREYFNAAEILDIIKHADDNGDNNFIIAAQLCPKEILLMTWNEIKKAFNANKQTRFPDFLKWTNNDGANVLCAILKGGDVELLKFFWIEFENFLGRQQFQDGMVNRKALCEAANCKNVKFHETLWELLLRTFKNREELMNLIKHKSEDGINFIHSIVTLTDFDVIEFTIKKLNNIYSAAQVREILTTKGPMGRNLLHTAAAAAKDIKIHRFLWAIFRNFCKSDEEFLELIKDADDQKNNVLQHAVCATAEIFNFMIKEVEFLATNQVIRDILSGHVNILQVLAAQNKSLEAHANLWTIIHKYFSSIEIADMIRHGDDTENPILFLTAQLNTFEVMELTWKEIRKVLSDAELIEHLKSSSSNGKNNFHVMILCCEVKKFRFICSQLKDCSNVQELGQQLSQKTVNNNNVLQLAVCNPKYDFHEVLWDFLLMTIKNREDLLDLFIEKDEDGYNFVSRLATLDVTSIFELTLQKIQENFTKAQRHQILSAKSGEMHKSILQEALTSTDVEELRLRKWKILVKNCDTSEIRDMIWHKDVNGNNALFYAVNITMDVAMLLWKEIISILSDVELSDYLKEVNNNGQNILNILHTTRKPEVLKYFWMQIRSHFKKLGQEIEFKNLIFNQNVEFNQNILHSIGFCENIEMHKTCWNLLLDIIDDRQELMTLMTQKDGNGNNFLQCLVPENSADVVKFTLNVLKQTLDEDQYEKFLMLRDRHENTLLLRLAPHCEDLRKFQTVCAAVQFACKSTDKFLAYFKATGIKKMNILFATAATSSSDIFEYTIKTLEGITSRDIIKDMMSIKVICNMNILQSVTIGKKSLKSQQLLWKLLRQYFSSDEVIDMITNENECGTNLLYFSVVMNTNEVAEFVWNEVCGVLHPIGAMIQYVKENGSNILHKLVQENESETLKIYWQKMENYFSVNNVSQQFIEIVKEKSTEGSNSLLQTSIKCEEIECHVTLWELLLNTFENREELKEYILQENENGDNFIHCLCADGHAEVKKFIFKKIKENLNDTQCQQIMMIADQILKVK